MIARLCLRTLEVLNSQQYFRLRRICLLAITSRTVSSAELSARSALRPMYLDLELRRVLQREPHQRLGSAALVLKRTIGQKAAGNKQEPVQARAAART